MYEIRFILSGSTVLSLLTDMLSQSVGPASSRAVPFGLSMKR